MKLSLIELRLAHPELAESAISKGTLTGDILTLRLADWLALRGNPIPAPIPRSQWPPWATQLALRSHPSDHGLGDTSEREIGPFGSDPFKLWWAETNGIWSKVCRCGGWKPIWNARFPFV